jgi:cytochrome c oxidase subunit 4
MSGGERHEPAVPVRYLLVWLIMMGLSAGTVALSYVPLGNLQLPAAMLIAAFKGSLVVLVFMHLGKHPKAARIAFLGALFFLGLLVLGTLSDLWTRLPVAAPSARQWHDR